MLEGNIFITGGTGTMAKAILLVAEQEGWDAEFTLYARSESRLAAVKQRFPRVRTIIGDIRDYDRLQASIVGHDLVLHLAALKRLPECEAHPNECVATNVVGTQNVVRACIAGHVLQCVGISTDKAVAALTCYGASKKLLESLFMGAPSSVCLFSVVRYGNVVASTGSVVPLWRSQAAEGKPLTITERDCTRFWMAPSDAVRLVVESLAMKKQAILVPKMKSLSIGEMAEIIAPGAPITEIGFRSLEKRHEDLIHKDELVVDQTDDSEAGRFVIAHAGFGASNISYASKHAPHLLPDEFLAMLAEADRFEREA